MRMYERARPRFLSTYSIIKFLSLKFVDLCFLKLHVYNTELWN